jgi:hypothetical protein
MRLYYSHIKQASDYNLTVGIESLQQGDLMWQGGVVLSFVVGILMN